MTLGEWLDQALADAPDVLARRMREVLAPHAAAAIPSAADAMLAEADAMLRALVDADPASRDTAFELLAVDAIVTMAFELSADDPACADRADAAMTRLAAAAR